MRIWANDIKSISELLEKEMSSGNRWVAYNAHFDYARKEELFYFKNENEFERFCIENNSENALYFGWPIKPHLDTITNILAQPKDHSVNYSLDDTYQIYTLDSPEIQEINKDTMENNYPIPRNILEGFDVAGLMTKMAGADWYYDYTEDPDVWDKGINQVNGIKADLLQLSKMENGVMAANYLWDAYVPAYSVNKPVFLLQETKNDLSTLKNNIMNQDNLDYLKNNLKYTGFSDTLNADLEKKIDAGVSEFTLNHTVESNNKKMEGTLHFKRGDQNEMYFFNRYDAKLTKADGAELEQTFYIDKGRGFTFKEATNLLEGRAVNKDLVNKKGEEYNAWVKLDFDKKNDSGNYEKKTYHENFGYDLEKALAKHSIQELNDPIKRDQLIASLLKGNLQAATDQNGERIFIVADPESGKSNKVTLYDKNLREITVEVRNVKQQSKGEEMKNSPQQGSKQTADDLKGKAVEKTNGQKKGGKKQSDEEGDLLPKANKKKVRGKGKDGDNELLPKNKEGTGKGMKV